MPDRELRVGVVDSGFALRQASSVVGSAAFVMGGEVVRRGEVVPDALGHGSALIDVIATLAPEARFVVAQVFGTRLACTAAQVAAAIDWLVTEGVDVINLSLGLAHHRAVLAEACARAACAGVILCASSPARGAPVYPAAYPGVLRMTGDARCGRNEISHLATTQADYGAHVRGLDGAMVAGASVGCAHLCGHVVRHLAAGGDRRIDAVRAWLSAQARYHGPERR
jgi:subtilisin family serine protease